MFHFRPSVMECTSNWKGSHCCYLKTDTLCWKQRNNCLLMILETPRPSENRCLTASKDLRKADEVQFKSSMTEKNLVCIKGRILLLDTMCATFTAAWNLSALWTYWIWEWDLTSDIGLFVCTKCFDNNICTRNINIWLYVISVLYYLLIKLRRGAWWLSG